MNLTQTIGDEKCCKWFLIEKQKALRHCDIFRKSIEI
jgi:hypothetical protein